MSKPKSLPLAFMARMAVLLDEEFPRFLVALNQKPRSALRVNTLKSSAAELLALTAWDLEPIPWCPDGFFLPSNTNAGLHPLHNAGLYYIQEPSTLAVATLLGPQPGERVLDLCASPGGKSTHIVARLAGRGLLVSNEIDRGRAALLVRNLERWGASNALVLNETPDRLAERWPGAFDRVLVDAPCSGEGMFRKNEDARAYWSEAHVQGCALRQGNILDAAARLVRPGGWLGYATCTFAPEENEGVIARFLQRYPDFELVEPACYPGFEPGRPEWMDWPVGIGEEGSERANGRMGEWANEQMSKWVNEAASYSEVGEDRGGLKFVEDGQCPVERAPLAELDWQVAVILSRTVRLWPHKLEGEGHFVAVLRRAGGPATSDWPPAQASEVRAADQAAIEAFWSELIDRPLSENLIVRPRDPFTAEVYAPPAGAPDVAGLRAPRPGWHLGTLRTGSRPGGGKGRFQPSQGLALALRAAEVRHCLDEPLGSEQIARYLRGETLRLPGPDGWLLVCVAGFPLGWGKRSGGVVKNHYPKALRWL